MKTPKKEMSHNVYSDKTNYRIRLYMDDVKFFEKQLKLPHLQLYSLSEQVATVLREFIIKILDENKEKDMSYLIDAELINAFNRVITLSQMIQKLRCENE